MSHYHKNKVHMLRRCFHMTVKQHHVIRYCSTEYKSNNSIKNIDWRKTILVIGASLSGCYIMNAFATAYRKSNHTLDVSDYLINDSVNIVQDALKSHIGFDGGCGVYVYWSPHGTGKTTNLKYFVNRINTHHMDTKNEPADSRARKDGDERLSESTYAYYFDVE